jgi:hypothetical protein
MSKSLLLYLAALAALRKISRPFSFATKPARHSSRYLNGGGAAQNRVLLPDIPLRLHCHIERLQIRRVDEGRSLEIGVSFAFFID